MYSCTNVQLYAHMLDKDTVRRQGKHAEFGDTSAEDDCHLVECLERAKHHVDQDEIKECFDRAIGLECIR